MIMRKHHRLFSFFLFLSINLTSLAELPETPLTESSTELPETSIAKKPIAIPQGAVEATLAEKPTAATQIPGAVVPQEKIDLALVEEITNSASKQLGQIHIMLSMISNIIASEHMPVSADTKEEIKKASYYLQVIQQEKFIHTDQVRVSLLLDINYQIMRSIKAHLENKATKNDVFNPLLLVKRATDTKITAASLRKKTTRNTALFDSFNKTIENIGLTRWNKAFRVFDDNIILPAIKHSVVSRVSTLAFASFVIAYFAWRTDTRYSGFLADNLFGPIPPYNEMHVTGGSQTNTDGSSEKTYSSLIHIENFIKENIRGSMPIFATFAGLAAAGFLSEYKNNIEEWLHKKIQVIYNTCKGGVYRKNALDASEDIDESLTFDDLVGMEEVKTVFKQIIQFLKDPESFTRASASPPRGILLVGGSRTGKSHGVKVFTNEINKMQKQCGKSGKFNFFIVNKELIESMGVPALFAALNQKAPCVIFIDEIDLLGLQRQGGSNLLDGFLTYMSGATNHIDPKKPIIMIGATNCPQYMAKELIKPGRFEKVLVLEYPTTKNRKEFLLRKLDKLSLDPRFFNLDELAQRTEGASYGALEVAVCTAVLKARLHNQSITQAHLEDGIDEVIHHVTADTDKPIPAHEKEILAAHFAAHALALWLSEGHTKLSMVTIQAITPQIKERIMGMHLWQEQQPEELQLTFGGVMTHHAQDTINLQTKEEKLSVIRYLLAGFIGEELLIGSCGFSCHKQDTEQALAIAQSITFEGLDPNSKSIPKEVRAKRFAQAEEIIETCKKEVRELLTAHSDKLQLLSFALKETQKLTGTEVNELLTMAGSMNKNELLELEKAILNK